MLGDGCGDDVPSYIFQVLAAEKIKTPSPSLKGLWYLFLIILLIVVLTWIDCSQFFQQRAVLRHTHIFI